MSSFPVDPELAREALRVRDEFGVTLPIAMRLTHRFGSVEAIGETSIDDLREDRGSRIGDRSSLTFDTPIV